MAIDSQQKRMSVCGVGRPWLRRTFPVASPTRGWRASIGLTYAGLTFAAAAIAAGGWVTGIAQRFTRPAEIA